MLIVLSGGARLFGVTVHWIGLSTGLRPERSALTLLIVTAYVPIIFALTLSLYDRTTFAFHSDLAPRNGVFPKQTFAGAQFAG